MDGGADGEGGMAAGGLEWTGSERGIDEVDGEIDCWRWVSLMGKKMTVWSRWCTVVSGSMFGC